MRFLRGLLGGLLWIVASLLGLVAVLLCVTVILLPIGIPLLALSRRLFGRAVALWLPRGVRHPVDEMGRQARKRGKAVTPDKPVPDTVTKALKSSRKVTRKAGRKAGKAVGRKTKRFAGRRRGRLF